VQEIVEGGLMANAAETGAYFRNELLKIKTALPHLVRDVRGKGLMVGAELSFPGKKVVDRMLERHIIINCTHTTVLRFLPPLIVTKQDVETLCMVLREVLADPDVLKP
jgi:acetylornithine/succinyldiaminopimelate/putrescine aminotransferase